MPHVGEGSLGLELGCPSHMLTLTVTALAQAAPQPWASVVPLDYNSEAISVQTRTAMLGIMAAVPGNHGRRARESWPPCPGIMAAGSICSGYCGHSKGTQGWVHHWLFASSPQLPASWPALHGHRVGILLCPVVTATCRFMHTLLSGCTCPHGTWRDS